MQYKPIHKAAHKHMQEAHALGWHGYSMICDCATEGLVQDGHSEVDSRAAVDVVWADKFAITKPI